MAPPTITEAVVLRSFAFGEADRVLHVYTQASGRVGVVAKGVRRTKSRFGGRLEPFSHVELSIHRGRGELGTVTGASLVRSHDSVRTDPYRIQVGLVGLEAMLRLFTEEERNALTRARPAGWAGYARRIDQPMLAEVGFPASARPRVFVCGPTSIVESASQLLLGLGHERSLIKTERFGPTGG